MLGVYVSGSKVYLALRTVLGCLDDSQHLRRVEPSEYMNAANRLYDFCQRFQQLLKECHPAQVAFLHTRNYRPNSYGEAFKRASIESAVMISACAEGIRYRLVRQEDVASHLSLPTRWRTKDLGLAAAQLRSDKPMYWNERSFAYAAAVTAAALDETEK